MIGKLKMEKTVRLAPPELSPTSSRNSSIEKPLDKARRRELEAAVRSVVVQVPASNASTIIDDTPYHVFSKHQIRFIVFLVSLVATFSGLSTSIYYPAQVQISESLSISPEVVNLSITTYLIAQGLSPSFWGPIADVIGRRQILIYTLGIYSVANIGLALVQNAPMLLIFRLLQAFGSSSTISVGAGVIADLAPPQSRGGYLGMFAGIRQFSLALAPVIGGILGQFLGFRSIFWFLTIFSVVVLVIIVLFLPETHRRIAGNGSVRLHKFAYRPLASSCVDKRKNQRDPENAEDAEKMGLKPYEEAPKITVRCFFEPMLFLLEKDVACALFFGACVYTSWSMVVASTNGILTFIYGYSTLQVGFCFLANGVGCVLGSVFSGRSLNSSFKREGYLWQFASEMKYNTPLPKNPLPLEFPLERARLGDVGMYSVICIISLLIYGWSLMPDHGESHRTNVNIIVPLLAQFALGFAATAVLNGNNTLTVDLYPGKSASATAVNNLARCSMGAVGVSLVEVLLKHMRPGWLCVFLAGLILIGDIPITLQWLHGKRWRAERASRHASRAASLSVSKCASRIPSRYPSPSRKASKVDTTSIGSTAPVTVDASPTIKPEAEKFETAASPEREVEEHQRGRLRGDRS